MDAYFCNGPFHLLSLFNIALTINKGNAGHCYVYNCFRGASDVADRLRAEGIYESVFLINENPHNYAFMRAKDKKIMRKIRLAKGLHSRKIKKSYYGELPLSYQHYDKAYIAGDFNHLYHFFARGVAKGMQIFAIDDGLSNRTNSDFYDRKYKLIHKLLNLFKFDEKISGLLYFNYEMTVNNYKQPMLKMDNVLAENKQLLYRLFNIDNAIIERFNASKYIVLMSGMELYSGRIEGAQIFANAEYSLYEKMAERLGENIFFKPHPASTIDFNFNVMQTSAPFEVLALGSDMSEKVIISPFSTALFNSKFLFDAEPKIIILFKLLDIDMQAWFGISEQDVDKMFKNLLIKPYRDKSKITIVTSEENLWSALDTDKNERILNEVK